MTCQARQRNHQFRIVTPANPLSPSSVGASARARRLVFTPAAQKDARKAARSPLRSKIEKLLELLGRDPFESPPPYEKLVGDLEGACSRRINIQHRLVYQVLARERVVKVLRMWTHYE